MTLIGAEMESNLLCVMAQAVSALYCPSCRRLQVISESEWMLHDGSRKCQPTPTEDCRFCFELPRAKTRVNAGVCGERRKTLGSGLITPYNSWLPNQRDSRVQLPQRAPLRLPLYKLQTCLRTERDPLPLIIDSCIVEPS